MSQETVVHLLRHGEVDNPTKVLYGRLPGFRLSALGEQMAAMAAKAVAGRDITYVMSSPLERAQQTAEPFAAQFGLPIEVDDRLIESANFFEGKKVGVGDGALRDPRNWRMLRNPFLPSWGEPYVEVAVRMNAALRAARALAAGHEALLRLASAADLDAAPLRRTQAPVARPAPAAVRAGQPDQLPLRRGDAGRHRLLRTGGRPGRPVPHGSHGQGGLSGSPGWATVACSRSAWLAGCTATAEAGYLRRTGPSSRWPTGSRPRPWPANCSTVPARTTSRPTRATSW